MLTCFPQDMEALRMVDAAYLDRDEWIKKSIRTTAKVNFDAASCHVGRKLIQTLSSDGQIQLGQGYSRLRSRILEHRKHSRGINVTIQICSLLRCTNAKT